MTDPIPFPYGPLIGGLLAFPIGAVLIGWLLAACILIGTTVGVLATWNFANDILKRRRPPVS